jgi:outer membrane protein OmpA-like peptidoglycan-associated protein
MFNLVKPTIILTAGAFTLAACTDDPDKTKKGAAIGAATGLISGILTGDDSNGKIKRTIAGAAIGAAIGNELDKQEEELRSDLGGSGAVITNTGDRLIVTLPEAITFDTDSSSVRPSLAGSLVQLAASLNKYPDTDVDVIGHTDNVGDASYNQGLSNRRAQAVSTILANNGVSGNRLRAYGRGENQPVASNDTSSGRAANRRVEVIITPAG